MTDNTYADIIEAEIVKLRPMILRSIDADDAEDVIQNIMLSLWQALPKYRGEAKISTYAYTIAKRRIADYYRDKYRRQKMVTALQEIEADGTHVKETVLESDLSWITVREEQVLRLVGCGLDNDEIARALNISKNTTRSHIKQINAKLGVTSRVRLAIFADRIYRRTNVS